MTFFVKTVHCDLVREVLKQATGFDLSLTLNAFI